MHVVRSEKTEGAHQRISKTGKEHIVFVYKHMHTVCVRVYMCMCVVYVGIASFLLAIV